MIFTQHASVNESCKIRIKTKKKKDIQLLMMTMMIKYSKVYMLI